MPEYLPSNSNDETVRISREIIDNLEDEKSIGPNEVKVLLPEKSQEEQTFFRVGEVPLGGSQDPDLFSFRMNENGDWVLEGTNADDSWTIPRDVEFSLGSDGAYVRLRGDDTPPRPVGRGRLPLVVQRFIEGAAKEQALSGKRSRVVLVSHPSSGDKDALLSIKNAGEKPLPVETHYIESEEPLKEEPENVDKAAEKLTETEDSVVVVPETTQAADMNAILQEGRTQEAINTESEEAEKVVEPVSETKATASPPKLSIVSRLAGLSEEPDAGTFEVPAKESEHHQTLKFEGLDTKDAARAVVDYISTRFDAMSASTETITERMRVTLPNALRIGYLPVESGVLNVLDDMKRIFSEHGEEITTMAGTVKEYINDEGDIFKAQTTKDHEGQATRKAIVGVMEMLDETLEGMEIANANVLNMHRILDDRLRTVHQPYYPDNPQHRGLNEEVTKATKDLDETLEEKTKQGRKARRLLQELDDLQKSL
jgi:hypothetical protein